jgi:23S rRNA G2445 N2-methylase RlmL
MFKRFKNWIRKIARDEALAVSEYTFDEFINGKKFNELITKNFQMAISQAIREHNESHPMVIPPHPDIRREIDLILEHLKLEIKQERVFGEAYFPHAGLRLTLVEKGKKRQEKKLE